MLTQSTCGARCPTVFTRPGAGERRECHVSDGSHRVALARLCRLAPRALEPPRAAGARRPDRRGPVPRAVLARGIRLLHPPGRDLLRAQARRSVALDPAPEHAAPLDDLP